MRRGAFTLVVALVVSFAAALTASATVKRVSLTSPVTAGGQAALTVNVAPRARCAITVEKGTALPTSRLAPKIGGRITWRWRLQDNAPLGKSPIVVKCGKSGALRTKLTILAAEPELPLADAAKAVCDQVPGRVMAKYKTGMRPYPANDAMRMKYPDLACVFFSGYQGGGFYYYVSVTRGVAPCTFGVTARLRWINVSPGLGWTGPVNETYTETCKSLRG